MTGHRAAILCALLLLSAATVTNADTIIVDLNGGADYTAIRPAVDAASQGDTVLVLPGYYDGPENSSINFNGKDIELRSVDGADSTIINGYMFDHIFLLQHWEHAIIEGFTAGYTSALALVCNDAHVTVRGCRFTNLSGFGDDPIWAQGTTVGRVGGGSLTLEDCLFTNNSCRATVSTLNISDCLVTVRNCVFLANDEGGLNLYNDPSGVLVIRGVSSVALEGCTFIDNVAEDCCFSAWGTTDVDVVDCTFEGNRSVSSLSTEGLLHFANSGSVEISGCTVSGNLNVDSCVSVSGTADVHIGNCTFASNGGLAEEIISIDTGSRGTISVSNSVLAFNDCLVPISCDGTLPTISACCFYETGDPDAMCQPYDPQTVLLEDPLFCGLTEGDYTLCANSQCLPENNEWDVQIGAHGLGCDACDSPVELTSWGAIKAMFR